MTPRSMSRTTLITDSFVLPLSSVIPVVPHLLTPAVCCIPVSGISSCVGFLCVQYVLGLFSSWGIGRRWLQKIHFLLRAITTDSAAEHRGGLWAIPGPPFLAAQGLTGTPQPAIPWRGSTKCRGGGRSCSASTVCLVSCKINTWLYIFREQKNVLL